MKYWLWGMFKILILFVCMPFCILWFLIYYVPCEIGGKVSFNDPWTKLMNWVKGDEYE